MYYSIVAGGSGWDKLVVHLMISLSINQSILFHQLGYRDRVGHEFPKINQIRLIYIVGNWRMPVLGDLNERAISLEEVGEAVNEMKSGTAPGLDGFPVECLKKGGIAVLEWLVRLLNLSFDMGVVPMDWCGACIVPLYKEKGDKCECSNSRGIS